MKKKKTQSGYAEFNMQDFARKLVVGVNLSPSSREIKETIKQNLTSQNTNQNHEYDKFDLGINLGVGFNISKKIRSNARYFLGLLERDNGIKSSTFSLGIEYNL